MAKAGRSPRSPSQIGISPLTVHHWPASGRPVRWSVHPHQPAARTIISQRLCISSLRQQPAAVGLRRCAYTRNASALLMLLRPGVEWCVRGTTSWVRCGSRGADVSASQASWRGEMGVIRRGRLTPMVTRGEMGVIRRGRLTPMVTRGEMGVIRRGRLSPMVTQCIAPPLPPVCFRGHTLECMLHNEMSWVPPQDGLVKEGAKPHAQKGNLFLCTTGGLPCHSSR